MMDKTLNLSRPIFYQYIKSPFWIPGQSCIILSKCPYIMSFYYPTIQCTSDYSDLPTKSCSTEEIRVKSGFLKNIV